MEPAASTGSRSTNKPSCIRCAERKVKCDRQDPCTACIKHTSTCVFPDVHLPRKRQKRVHAVISTDEKVKRYEALLYKNGIDPNEPLERIGTRNNVLRGKERGSLEESVPFPTPESTATTASELIQSLTTTQLLHDQRHSIFVGK
jgi:hypothetical protein